MAGRALKSILFSGDRDSAPQSFYFLKRSVFSPKPVAGGKSAHDIWPQTADQFGGFSVSSSMATTLVLSEFFERQLASWKHFIYSSQQKHFPSLWSTWSVIFRVSFTEWLPNNMFVTSTGTSQPKLKLKSPIENFMRILTFIVWYVALSFETPLILIRIRDEIPLLSTPTVLQSPKLFPGKRSKTVDWWRDKNSQWSWFMAGELSFNLISLSVLIQSWLTQIRPTCPYSTMCSVLLTSATTRPGTFQFVTFVVYVLGCFFTVHEIHN